MVGGEVKGVLVPQQPVVGVVPMALPAIRAVVVVIQDLGEREDGGSEEDHVRLKPRGCSNHMHPVPGEEWARAAPAHGDGSCPQHPCPLLFSIHRSGISACPLGVLQADAGCCGGAGRHTHLCTHRSPSHHCYTELKPNSFSGPVLGTWHCLQDIIHPAHTGHILPKP